MGGGFKRKPRPYVIIQAVGLEATTSVTLCPLTSSSPDIQVLRPVIRPSAGNGLERASWAMVDKLQTLEKSQLGKRIGRLADEDVTALDRSLIVYLGLV